LRLPNGMLNCVVKRPWRVPRTARATQVRLRCARRLTLERRHFYGIDPREVEHEHLKR